MWRTEIGKKKKVPSDPAEARNRKKQKVETPSTGPGGRVEKDPKT